MKLDPEMMASCVALLRWFARQHPRGSQTSSWDRWAARAVEETVELGLPPDQTRRALEYLRDRGFIETADGTGSFRGAKVTTITDRGRRFLDRVDGDPVYDADVLIAGLRSVIAALAEASSAHAKQIADLDHLVSGCTTARPPQRHSQAR